MSDDEKSLFDKVKDAFGMGEEDGHDHGDEGHDHAAHDHAAHDHAAHDHAAHDESADNPRIDKDTIGVDGATQGAASTGAGGGMGASAGLGGAGAGAAADSTPDPSKDWAAPADGTNVRTEYEMGHEFDPDHEQVAESGVLAEQADEAVVDTWRSGDEERDPAK